MSGASGPRAQFKTHISLNVSNIERSLIFYEAFFGVSAHKRRAGYANFDLVDPPLKLALQEIPPETAAGSLNHLGLQVSTPEMVAAARKRLIDAGLATFDEGDTLCCYARQDKIWAHDPDGVGWEVYFLLDDMLENHTDHHADDHSGLNLEDPDKASCCSDQTNICCAG